MKKNIYLLFVLFALLAGCGKDKQEKEILNLQTKVDDLQTKLVADEASISNDEATSLIFETNVQAFMEADIKLTSASSSASGSTPGEINPATGLPMDQPLIVFPASGRVTESNDQWWRWAVKFAIGNPNSDDTRRNAHIKFLDADGYVIDTADVYDLVIPADSTNYFSSYELVNLPGAANVKSIQVELEQ
jgi:hypothetical protein